MPRIVGSDLNDVISAAYRLHADIVAAGDAMAEPFGLSAARWQLLGAIALGGDVTVPDLARTIGTARQSVQRIVSELVDHRLLWLADNPRHRRAKLVRMTDAGRDAYHAVMNVWSPDAVALEHQVGPAAARDLARSMAELAAAFHAIAERRERNAGTTTTNSEGNSSNEPRAA